MMPCLAHSSASVRPCRPIRGNVRAAARKNPAAGVAVGLAAAVLLSASAPAQAGLLDGLLQQDGGSKQSGSQGSQGFSTPSGLPSTSENLGNGPPAVGKDDIAQSKTGGVKDPTNTAEEVGPIPQGPDASK